MYTLGYDIGSSSIKCAFVDIGRGNTVASGFYPQAEMEITAQQQGWAEQQPITWWNNLVHLTRELLSTHHIDPVKILAIGISYQMHGLVCIDKHGKVLRPSIIWCDSRATEIGRRAMQRLGKEYALQHLLNSPGNFTASKLRWVKEHEPDVFNRTYKFLLPGDYIAMKLTGEVTTTVSGLSEGIFWDFQSNSISKKLLEVYELHEELFPTIVPTFSIQGVVSSEAADELGIRQGTPVAYRAGDQPNNAFSLHVLQPGEFAATAGTSGVVYGVTHRVCYDERSRVNQFAHVNHSAEQTRLGVLLCVNGTGILNSWIRKNFMPGISYEQMNSLAETCEIGLDDIQVFPFGNGAERMFEEKSIGCQIIGIDFNRHTSAHILRAIQEGIACSFRYGVDIMREMGLSLTILRAGRTNLFLSRIFRESIANLLAVPIELFDTDGAHGAARGAAVGAGIVTEVEAFKSLQRSETIEPKKETSERFQEVYQKWKNRLDLLLRQQ
jgi:xylulokinase